MSMNERLGIIDLGSNSSRLVIYDIYPNQSYRPVFEMKQNIQLAHNMGKDHKITQEAIARAVACSKLFLRAGMLHGVTKWIAVATAAVRQASNRDEVLRSIEEEASLTFRVLSGEEEGRYGFIGVMNTIAIDDALLVDIGGGSSELMYVRGRSLKQVVSIPYGALNLTERFQAATEPELGNLARAFFEEQLKAIPWLEEALHLPVIGLGGTARALAKLDALDQSEAGERIHGYRVTADFVQSCFNQLKTTPSTKRKKIKGLGKHRSEMIVAGLAVLSAVMNAVVSPELIISRSGVREGLFFEYMFASEDLPALVPSVLEHSLANFQRVFHVNKQVASVVSEMALQLFDALKDIHQLPDTDRRLLWVTSQIEGCGTYINTEKWTKHSAYLVLSSHLHGLSPDERSTVSALLEGRGKGNIRKLSLLIQLSKLLTLQLGISSDAFVCRTDGQSVQLGKCHRIQETVSASANADIATDFERIFGIPLQFIDSDCSLDG